jgi:PAS domain S-box-containing protein
MDLSLHSRAFLRSRSGHGCILFLSFSALVAFVVACGIYSANLKWFTAHKGEEKLTALQLVDAFVTNYTDLRAKFGAESPVPASFRAHSIELFNKMNGDASEFRLLWVGRPGRSIVTPPSDPAMAKTIENFATAADPKAQSEFLTVAGSLAFRTVYPSFARQQSCVDCHNKIQPDLHWRLGDLMGAFVIDVPAGPFLASNLYQSVALAVALFLVLAVVGLFIAILHYRQIAARETVQASLAVSEERFRDFAEFASDWFWELDENLRCVFASPGMRTAKGDSAIGKSPRDMVQIAANSGLSEEQWNAHEANLLARRPFDNFRVQQFKSDGSGYYISISGKPVFDGTGRFTGYRCIGSDVTAEVAAELEFARRVEERTAELRRAQSDLLRKERLSTLGQLTATVAHELRNPLSAIRNTIFAMKESMAAMGTTYERPLTRVERNIQRCDRIITDLLDFTRLRELNRATIDADQWLEELLNEQRVPDGIELRRQFGTRDRLVSFDPERMRRVVINLIENAAQALAEASDLDRPRVITVSTRTIQEQLEITIEDTGPGISSEVLSKVFEPLFSTKSFGTGLGLPTVKQIVEQHGGTVTIASDPGKGTRIVVRLPIDPAEEMAA